jgi:hypothetical protein
VGGGLLGGERVAIIVWVEVVLFVALGDEVLGQVDLFRGLGGEVWKGQVEEVVGGGEVADGGGVDDWSAGCGGEMA